MNQYSTTKQYFNRVASQWDSKTPQYIHHLNKLLLNLDIQPYHTVLDIGCGTGILFPFIKNLTGGNLNFIAMDIAHGMAALASQKKYDFIKITCGCARYLPFNDNTFDRLIAFHVFPHLSDKQKTLQECWRVLKPNGAVGIIHLHSSEELNEIHRNVGGAVKQHILPSGEMMRMLLHEMNFEVQTVVDKPSQYFISAQKPQILA